jgi:hypothetical protein
MKNTFSYFWICLVLLCVTVSAWAAKFPNKEEMMSRLYAVESDSTLRKEYFPYLYAYAEQEKNPAEISSIFLKTIDQFSKQMKTPQMIRAQLIPRAFTYIKTLFSDYPKEMKEALKILNQTYLSEN